MDTSVVFTEAYYFFNRRDHVGLLHVGFMTYEAGVSRRKNIMSTAMKNIMTIAVVTPTFYYLGWWVLLLYGRRLLANHIAKRHRGRRSVFLR